MGEPNITGSDQVMQTKSDLLCENVIFIATWEISY